MPVRLLSAIVGAVLCLPAAAQTLSFEEALALATSRSARLAAQRHSVSAAAEQVGRAGELPDPRLKLGIENLPVSGPNEYRYDRDFMTMRTIGWMQDFPNADKRAARNLRAERMRDVERAGLVAQGAGVRRETARAWLDAHYAERARAVVERLSGQFRLQVKAVAAGVASGRLPAAERYTLLQAEEQANDRAIGAARIVTRTRIALEAWVGDAAERPLGEVPDVTRFAGSRETLLARYAELPQLQALREREELARAEVELARASRHADWSLELGYSLRRPAFSNMVSVMAVFELPVAKERRQDRDVASRLAELERTRAEREDARRTLLADIRAALADFDTAAVRIGRSGRLLLPLAQERHEAALAAYRGGSGPLAAVLEAERARTEAELALVQAEAERARAWAELSFLYPQEAVQ